MILVENNCFNDRFDTIIDDLQKHNDFLDKTSRAAFMLAKSKYLDYSEREQDV